MFRLFFLFFTLLFSQVMAFSAVDLEIDEIYDDEISVYYENFEEYFQPDEFDCAIYAQDAHISPQMWEEAKPFFLPSNHPLKKKLDEIFKKTRASYDPSTLAAAGFRETATRKASNCVVTTHPKLKAHFIKLYYDVQSGDTDARLLKRVKGAKGIRDAIKKYRYSHLFKVPRKWLYPLPSHPMPDGTTPKSFIVIAEAVRLIAKNSNYSYWKSDRKVNQELLRALYTLLKNLGLKDSVHASNIPFATDRKVAFIDTEHYKEFPVHYAVFLDYLGPENRAYWYHLMQNY